MVDTEKQITQAKIALEEANKRRADEKNKHENMPKEFKGRGVLSRPDLVIGKSRV